MQHGQETAFLQRRRGFIRLAMQTGAHVVPCFAFGQTGTFSWFRPGPPLVSDASVQALSRRIGKFEWGTGRRFQAMCEYQGRGLLHAALFVASPTRSVCVLELCASGATLLCSCVCAGPQVWCRCCWWAAGARLCRTPPA
jgi:hypothetical protein